VEFSIRAKGFPHPLAVLVKFPSNDPATALEPAAPDLLSLLLKALLRCRLCSACRRSRFASVPSRHCYISAAKAACRCTICWCIRATTSGNAACKSGNDDFDPEFGN